MTIAVIVNVTGKLPDTHYVECEDYLPTDEALSVAEETIACQCYADGVVYQSLQSSVYAL
jgi:hypothetical protein